MADEYDRRSQAWRHLLDPERAGRYHVPMSAGDTTYLCTAETDGLAVSLIQSNASGFGSWLVEPTTGINLPFISADESGPRHLSRTLTRADFERLVADLVERTEEPCREALEGAGLVAGTQGHEGTQLEQFHLVDDGDLGTGRQLFEQGRGVLARIDEQSREQQLLPHAPGLTPRRVLEKFAAVQMIDVEIPVTDGRTIQLTRYTEPPKELKLLLERLRLELPAQPPPKITAAQAETATPL